MKLDNHLGYFIILKIIFEKVISLMHLKLIILKNRKNHLSSSDSSCFETNLFLRFLP